MDKLDFLGILSCWCNSQEWLKEVANVTKVEAVMETNSCWNEYLGYLTMQCDGCVHDLGGDRLDCGVESEVLDMAIQH